MKSGSVWRTLEINQTWFVTDALDSSKMTLMPSTARIQANVTAGPSTLLLGVRRCGKRIVSSWSDAVKWHAF
jgi:hypothetical protein